MKWNYRTERLQGPVVHRMPADRAIVRPVRLHPCRIAVIVAVLCALLWQSLVAKAHHHEHGSAPVSISSFSVDGGSAAGQNPFDEPSACPICQEVAHAGNYLLPDLRLALPTREPDEIWFGDALGLAIAIISRSHAWQSRAPPYALQT